MLLVNASKGPSAIHGIGLIAREFIRKGKAIWAFDLDMDHEYAESFFKSAMVFEHSKWAALQLKRYSFFDGRRGCWVCCGDDARFTNHSDYPNTFMDEKLTYAARDILLGEEITEDYRLLGVEMPRHDFAIQK